MRWEDAPYVKLYRDNGPWMDLSLEARGLFDELLKVVDRAGILRLGADPVKTVARAVNGHPDRVSGYLDELTRDGCVTVRDGALVMRNYVAAQSARASDKARQAESRARASAAALSTNNQSVAKENVTHRSHDVTHTSRSEENRSEEKRERAPRTRKVQTSIWTEQAKTLLAELNVARMMTISGTQRLEPTAGNLKYITERLAAGETADAVRHVIAVYAHEVLTKGDKGYFNAVTPFREDNFARALSQPLPKTNGATKSAAQLLAEEARKQREAEFEGDA
jgi:hypothetical protein